MRKKQKKSSLVPVLVVFAMILLIGTAGIISFFRNRYSPGTERMDGREYFQLENEDQVALILNRQVLETKGTLLGGEPYLTYEFVESTLNSCFYWDTESQAILLTTPAGVQKLTPQDTAVATSGGQAAVQMGTDGSIYLALELIGNYTDLEYAYYAEPSRAVLLTDFSEHEKARVSAENSSIRYRGGIKSPILTDVTAGTPLVILETLEDWCKVATEDGYIGYIQQKDLTETEVAAALESGETYTFGRISRDHKINLAWHQTTSPEANAAFSTVTEQMTGVNVISPTWFSVTDNSGTISSLASGDYVAAAHAAGLEVWGLIDNFSADFDTATALASSSVRANIISQLLEAAANCGMDGINVDFEQLKQEGIPHFLQFLRELTAAAHQQNLVISVDTPVPQSFTAYYDRAEQARFADYIIMMGYDEHYAGDDEAGSVASLPFVESGIQNLLEDIPVERIICGIPFYTRMWTEAFGQNAVTSEVLGMDGADTYAAQMDMTKTWDASLGQNVATVETEAARYTIWMEDEQSIEEKMKLISNYNLAGVAEWKLGFERSSVWEIISRYVN